MTSIGETLRRERTRRGLDLKSVSSELKISLKFLEAIEVEAFNKLPGGMFSKSFVRQYARYLGLDEDDMLAELERVIEPVAPAMVPKPSAPIEVPKVAEWQVMNDRPSWASSLPALALVVVVMLVCSGVYSWWQRSKSSVYTAPQTAAVAPPTQSQPPEPVQPQPQPQAPPVVTQPAPERATVQATPATPAKVTEPAPATPQHQDVGSADRPAPEPPPVIANKPPAAAP